jgi:Phycobilisome protein
MPRSVQGFVSLSFNTMSQPSAKVQELITKCRIVSFASWHNSHPIAAIQCLQAADDQGRYLSDQDFQLLQTFAPTPFLGAVKLLRDQATEIVAEARSSLLARFPHISEPGGGLYPPERTQACWRDFWQFLRCITYGIAGARSDYTSQSGLAAMQELYRELRVPLDAMVVGLEAIKAASLKRVPPEQQPSLAPYFDHLIDQLKLF